MIGLDSNVVVRFLVEDDDEQSSRAAALVERAMAEGEDLFVSHIVLCEVVWVLSGAYGVRREVIADIITDLLRSRPLRIEEAAMVHRALKAWRKGRADFADYLIGEHAASAGCAKVATFDKALLKEPGYFRP